LPELDDDTATEVELHTKYAGYVRKEQASVARALRLEDQTLPDGIDYASLTGLRLEARQQLERVRPRTLGQASRIPGVTPADISVLTVQLERRRRGSRAS
jgi:tRNA uridine 5-carboxymethylaminomethyl modification enzyme